MDSKLEEFLRNAADCRQLALAAPLEFAKQHWLAMTRHWMKMAAAEEAAAKQIAAGSATVTKAPISAAPVRSVFRVFQ
jgi:hypothetical protein